MGTDRLRKEAGGSPASRGWDRRPLQLPPAGLWAREGDGGAGPAETLLCNCCMRRPSSSIRTSPHSERAGGLLARAGGCFLHSGSLFLQMSNALRSCTSQGGSSALCRVHPVPPRPAALLRPARSWAFPQGLQFGRSS